MAEVIWRHWIPIDRAWIKRREAILRAQEDAIIRATRDRATGAERVFMDALVRERERNAGRAVRLELS